MTKEEALKMLADAPHTDKPSRFNPGLTCSQGISVIENYVMTLKPGEILNVLTVKRVYQVCLNKKRPRIP